MNSFFEKCKTAFSNVWMNIKLFFGKTGSSIKKIFISLKLKIISKNMELKKARTEKDKNRQLKKEEKAQKRAEKLRKKHEQAEERKARLKSKGPRIFRTFLNIFDVIFEVIFSCGLFFCIRPELLNFKNKQSYFEQFDFDSAKLIFLGKLLPETEEVSNLAIFIIISIFATYLIYKIVFSLVTANGINKLISILLTVITLISVFLVKDKFLIFLILYVLLFATFQFSCGFDFKVCRTKFLIFICSAFVFYVLILLSLDEYFKRFAFLLISEMKLPIKWF